MRTQKDPLPMRLGRFCSRARNGCGSQLVRARDTRVHSIWTCVFTVHRQYIRLYMIIFIYIYIYVYHINIYIYICVCVYVCMHITLARLLHGMEGFVSSDWWTSPCFLRVASFQRWRLWDLSVRKGGIENAQETHILFHDHSSYEHSSPWNMLQFFIPISQSFQIPSGHQTWQWKMDHLSLVFPCLITRVSHDYVRSVRDQVPGRSFSPGLFGGSWHGEWLVIAGQCWCKWHGVSGKWWPGKLG